MTHYRMISRQRATERVHGAPLVRIAAKSPSHCAGWVTRKANERERKLAHCAALRAGFTFSEGFAG